MLASSIDRARAQTCLGRPIDAGEHSLAFRFDLEDTRLLGAEYSGAIEEVAWSGVVGAATRDLAQDFALALGGGLAWTDFSRRICPTVSVLTWEREAEGFSREPGDFEIRRTDFHLGVGIGTSTRGERFRGSAYVFPHFRFRRSDSIFGADRSDHTERDFWLAGGGSLRGERLWGKVSLGLRTTYREGEDLLDGSLRLAVGAVF